MRKTSSWVVVLLLLVSLGLTAQRGGGTGRGRGAGPDPAPILVTVYDNAEYGLKFPAPPDFFLFTPERPGKFRQMFVERRIIYLVDVMGVDAAVGVKYLPNATDAELDGFRKAVESNPPQAKLPDYKKISVSTTRIGAARDKDAVEYVYSSKEKETLTTTRQVVFIHKGNGFIFTCTAPAKDYESVDRKSFQRLFASIEFR